MAIGFGAFGVWFLRLSSHFPPSRSSAPGPGFFPELLAAVIVGLSVVQVVSVLLSNQQWERPRLDPGIGRVLLMVGSIVAFLFLWKSLRFEIASLVFLLGLTTFFGRGLIRQNLLFSLILTGMIVALFRYGLRVPF